MSDCPSSIEMSRFVIVPLFTTNSYSPTRTQSQRGKSPTRKRLQTTLGGSSLIADHEKEKDVEEIMDHTNLSPKVRLDEEKKSYDKAQRTHERMLKRLEEASARTATREARFRLKVRLSVFVFWCTGDFVPLFSCTNVPIL